MNLQSDKCVNDFSKSVYPANFDNSAFVSKNLKNTEYNRLTEDPCYINRREDDNAKRLKFYTTNHNDLINAQTERNNFFGINIENNLYTPSPENIDKYSNLVNGDKGGVMSQCKTRYNLPALPVQLPYRGQASRGDVDIEDSFRNYNELKKNSCLPKDTTFYNRSFYMFPGIETPDASKSVEAYVNGFRLGRNGDPTRFCDRFDC